MSIREEVVKHKHCDISGQKVPELAEPWGPPADTKGIADLEITFRGETYTFDDVCPSCVPLIRGFIDGLNGRAKCYVKRPRNGADEEPDEPTDPLAKPKKAAKKAADK